MSVIDGLPNLPTGYATRDESTPVQPDLRPQPASAPRVRLGIDLSDWRWSA